MHRASPLLTENGWPYSSMSRPEIKPTTTTTSFTESDWLSSEDDDIRFNTDTHKVPPRTFEEQNVYNEHFGICEDTPIRNILLHHPALNQNNVEYQKALGLYQQMFGQQTVAENNDTEKQNTDPVTFHIKTPIIEVPIRDPICPRNLTKIRAAADTGSEIDCVGNNFFNHYKSKGVTKHSKEGKRVRTGNGLVTLHHYVPITLKTSNGRFISTKFWYLKDLPTSYDWLIGVSLLKSLGWELKNEMISYEHIPRDLDNVDLDLPSCSNYPLYENEPEVDITKIKVGNKDIEEFIHQQLREHRECLARHEWDSGLITDKEFSIDFIDAEHPLKEGFVCKEYGMKPTTRVEVRRQIKGMREHRVVSKCHNAKHISSLFAIPKKTKDVRIVFDFRRLNLITKKLHYPIPLINEILAKFRGKAYISSLDMKGGYWHIPIKPAHRNRTAFMFEGEVYMFNVMPFGPTNAPLHFQQVMQSLFGHLDYVVVYLDDISILSDTLEEHQQHLSEVFKILKTHCIKLRLDKCLWAVSETEYLGFIVDKYGIRTKASYVAKILDVPEPKNKRALRRFLGLCQFLHRFIPQMHIPLAKLTPLTKKDVPNRFELDEEQRNAFNLIKTLIGTNDYLCHPNVDEEFHVFTDASQLGLGGMLAQWNSKVNAYQPVAYCSKVFNEVQQRWHVSEQELFAVIHCVEKWSSLLQHKKFILHTDHANLQILLNKATNFRKGKLFRWAVRIQDLHFECRYIKGEANTIADFLSRESVLLNHPQYSKIREFYDQNPYHHPTRQMMSNDGKGVDILGMYTMHLVETILIGKRSKARYQYVDPYLNPTRQQQLQRSPYKTDEEREDDVDSIATEEILDDKPSPPPYQPTNVSAGATSKPAFPEPDGPEEELRRSPRLKQQQKQKEVIKPKDLQIRSEKDDFVDSEEVSTEDRHTVRELRRALHSKANADKIEERPYLMTWNRNLLDPRHRVPIQNYYGSALSQDTHLTRQLIRAKQQDDAVCSMILDFLKTNNKMLILDLPEFIQRFVVSGRFVINEQNILCWKQHRKQHTKKRELVILKVAPAALRASLLKYAHSELHHGTSKMMRMIQQELGYWWPKMKIHVTAYCRCCNTCQHIKQGGYTNYKRSGKLQLFSATRPFQQISVDIVGPLPTTINIERYVVSMLDAFSRYCLLVAVTDVRAISVIKAIDLWISLFGAPRSILSDNGPQFISSVYRDYMRNHKDVKIKYTSTYNPRCNGQIERLHRWVKERLRLIAYDGALNFVNGEDSWADYLPIIQYTFNSTPNRITTYSPMDIVLGRNDYKLEPYHFDENNPFEYIQYLRKRQNIIESRAVARQEQYDEARKRAELRKQPSQSLQYEIGQKVLWNLNSQVVGNAAKLGPRWVGPYEIEDIFNGGQTFRIKVIPLPPNQRMNPMNEHKIPRRAEKVPRRGQSECKGRRNWRITTPADLSFTVARHQVKPYFAEFEQQFLGLLSPISLAKEHILYDLENANHIGMPQETDCNLHTPPVTWKEDESHQMLMSMMKNECVPFIIPSDENVFECPLFSLRHQYQSLLTLQHVNGEVQSIQQSQIQ